MEDEETELDELLPEVDNDTDEAESGMSSQAPIIALITPEYLIAGSSSAVDTPLVSSLLLTTLDLLR